MNYYNEFDPHKAAWLRILIAEGEIPEGWVDERSIHDVKPHELLPYTQHHFFAGIGGWSLALRLAGWPDWQRVRTGSCPCQPFSNAGGGKGFQDPRHLSPVFLDQIAFGEPTVTFGEQTQSELGRIWLSDLRARLEGLGHEVGAADLCAPCVGARHARQRLWWFAHPAGERLPKPRLLGQDAIGEPAHDFWEADRLVDALRRGAMPFLCREHDGIPVALGRIACHALGDAIVPQVAAVFIRSAVEAISA